MEAQVLRELNKLENEVLLLEKKKKEEYNLNSLHKIKKKLIDISIQYEEFLFKNNNNKNIDNKIKYLNKNINLLNEYYSLNINIKKHKNLNNISLINTIFLPLTLITGYFGMNFSKMGNPTLKKGILSINNAHEFILILFLISIISTSLLFHYNMLS